MSSSMIPTIAKFDRQQRGFNLLEVLVSLVVLALGLLGLAAMQNLSLKSTHQSMQRTQANMAISDMIDRMRANPTGVRSGSYSLASYTSTPPASTDCASASCTSAAMASYDMATWIRYLISPQVLGASGAGSIQLIRAISPSSAQYRIGVQWREGDLTLEQTMNVHLP